MENHLVVELFFVLLAALFGGLLTKILKLPTLIGYIIAGLLASLALPVFGLIGHEQVDNLHSLAELGIILLLFSIGLEVSIKKLMKVGKIVVYGSIVQMLLTMVLSWVFLMVFGFASKVAIILAISFALSSTAIVVKLLTDRSEKGTIHGEIMIGWLLMQDLAVIPIMTLLPTLVGDSTNFVALAGKSLLSAGISIFAVFFLGRLIVPPIIHKVAALNSRELLSLTAICIAIGTAFLVSAFGVSAALGAFLAGVVISESHENHAVFSETRPLRDLFVVLFFATLGFLVTPSAIVSNIFLIIGLSLFVVVLKTIIVWFIMFSSGYYGKTAVATSLGLSQIGEFAFVIYLSATKLSILDQDTASIGIATTLVTLMATPFVFKSIIPLWRKLKSFPHIGRYFWRGFNKEIDDKRFENHVIICGFGRVGKWVGKAMESAKIPYIAIDYNQKVVTNARKMGIKAIYGDPGEPEVLKEADIEAAKAIIITIPDIVSQHETISFVQTVAPGVKIIVRSDPNDEIETLKLLKVEKIVQPEFEGALAIVRDIFKTMGKNKEEISERMKSLRVSHSIKL